MVLCAELAHQLITAEQADFTDPSRRPGHSAHDRSVTPDERGERLQSQNERYVIATAGDHSVERVHDAERNGGDCIHRSHVLVTIN